MPNLQFQWFFIALYVAPGLPIGEDVEDSIKSVGWYI